MDLIFYLFKLHVRKAWIWNWLMLVSKQFVTFVMNCSLLEIELEYKNPFWCVRLMEHLPQIDQGIIRKPFAEITIIGLGWRLIAFSQMIKCLECVNDSMLLLSCLGLCRYVVPFHTRQLDIIFCYKSVMYEKIFRMVQCVCSFLYLIHLHRLE